MPFLFCIGPIRDFPILLKPLVEAISTPNVANGIGQKVARAIGKSETEYVSRLLPLCPSQSKSRKSL